jgi:Cu(I)/Ag(I) efflux system membrane protein CusA/SilA
MIRWLIGLSARHRYLVLMISAALCSMAWLAMKAVPLDALPDLSDTQVIVYSRWDRSPDLIEDQLTYPITTALLGSARVKAIRGFSDFGYSYVYVLFEDGTDLYWARSRVLESLSKLQGRLPQDARVELGPDATSVGWVFQYALVDEGGKQPPHALRSYQDWFLRYALQAVPGVAEVATVGGGIKQYQVTVDPVRLSAYRIGVAEVTAALRKGNGEVGGRLIELSGKEYMVRGRGYIQGVADIEQIVLRSSEGGTPVRVKDIGRVSLGPDLRRGVADLNGDGEVVGGIVLMRHGENARAVIGRVREALARIEPSLPEGVRLLTTYDRSELIDRSIDTLRDKLIEEIAIVSLVILIFLWHVPSALVPIITIPVSVLLSFIPLYFLGVGANIMSLSGIAISIGVLVDGAIVEVENAYRRVHLWEAAGRPGSFDEVRLKALQEVGPSVFFSLLVIAVAFVPVFTLVDQEGRLFRPLAYSKNLAMAIAAVLAVTLDPAMRMALSRIEPFRLRPRWLMGVVNAVAVGRYHAEERHPVSRVLFRLYEPVCRLTLRRPLLTLGLAILLVASAVPAYLRLGSEFMPPLNEGTILYMPTTLPGISVTEAARLLKAQDRVLRSFPEVASVFGKAGRAETSTDPAPLSMMETTVVLKPEAAWRGRARWYSGWAPGWLAGVLRVFWPDRISAEELVAEMDRALRLPGTTNAWTLPIKARIDMLATGMRTPVGVKIFGADPKEIERLGVEIEGILRGVPGTRSVFAERTVGGGFLDIEVRREELARYGLSVADVNEVVLAAIGGESVTTTVEGRARYGVSVRYPRELREDPEAMGRVLVSTPEGAQVPLSQVAALRMTSGPAMLRDENGLLAGYVYVDLEEGTRDIGGYVEEARRVVGERLRLPPGYTLQWSGQFENMLRVRERLKVVVPVTLFLIFLLLYANTGSLARAGIVLCAVPFSAVGAVWLLYALGYQVSIAVWVGIIALLGLDAETGVFMLLYLDLAYDEARAEGRLRDREDLKEAIVHGAVKRVRPKAMTVCAAFLGLLPILWASGAGADVMKRIAAPMVGGLVTSFGLELLVYPVIYLLWRGRGLAGGVAGELANGLAGELDRPAG